VQTDPGFGLLQLKSLAGQLHGLKPGKVVLLTVPLADTDAYRDIGGANASVVIWDQQRAQLLWNALRTDGPLPGTAPQPTASPSASASASPTLIVAPSHIRVRVLNGTGQAGIAHKVAQALAAEGFQIVGVGDADSSGYSTTFVRYGTTKNESSETLSAAVPGSTRQLDGSLGDVLQLVVGSNYSGVVAVQISTAGVPTPSPSPTATLDTITADRDVCAS
jgi:hypothetical protein